jgi:hypothetical protein
VPLASRTQVVERAVASWTTVEGGSHASIDGASSAIPASKELASKELASSVPASSEPASS